MLKDHEEILITGNETISFQNSDFGKELDAVFQNIIDTCKTIEEVKKSEKGKVLSKLIKKYTNLSIDVDIISNSFTLGPSIYIPALVRDSVITNLYQNNNANGVPFKTFTESVKKHKGKNYVDLLNAKVHGVFEDIKTTIHFPPRFIINMNLTARECSAILLHEAGHLFTYFEYVNKTVTTNQILESLSNELNKDLTIDDKKDIITNLNQVLDYAIIDDELLDSTDKNNILISLYKYSFKESLVSNSLYDETTSEASADQFSARFGYSKELALGLNKLGAFTLANNIIYRNYLYNKTLLHTLILSGIAIVNGLGLILLFCGLSFLIIFVSNNTVFKDYTYDNTEVRLKRLKEQLIQLSKDTSLDKEKLHDIIKDVKDIDELIKISVEHNGLLTAIGYFFFSKNKVVRKSIQLQRQLEELASNKLFLSAAKLRLAA